MSCFPSPSHRMNFDQMQAWILRQLGAPIIEVELDPCHLKDAIVDAIDWFLAHKGLLQTVIVPLISDQQQYPFPNDAQSVINVIPPGVRPLWNAANLIGYGQDTLIANGTGWGRFPNGASKANSAGGPMSSYVQSESYLQEARSILSLNFEWWVDEGARTIYVSPAPCGEGSIGIEYTTREFNMDMLNPMDYDLVKRFSLAKAKLLLGLIRSKFTGGVPGAQGNISLNGTELVQAATDEITKLTEDLRGSAMPAFFIAG